MNRISLYARLVRLNSPAGTLLLLFPTLSALWIASGGMPEFDILAIFVLGTIFMRCAGCAFNDFADRDFDKHVSRTKNRPLTSGLITPWEALAVAAFFVLLSFFLVIHLNRHTQILAIVALAITLIYPFFKRFFAIPQAFLGIAFGFGIPMAFAAVGNDSPIAWILLIANIFWTLAYDTEYAMADKEDDLKLGLKTSAITFGKYDILIISICYLIFLAILATIGFYIKSGIFFALGLLGAFFCAVYHIKLISTRKPEFCLHAFFHNVWVGALIFLGVTLNYTLPSLM